MKAYSRHGGLAVTACYKLLINKKERLNLLLFFIMIKNIVAKKELKNTRVISSFWVIIKEKQGGYQ
ncbi:hypothetical protein ABEW24_23940 [Paenibacillus jamilae]|uniref:hypothetical protein n=1 Tax=Paenibacillus TaxID=44249 RepID=UPI00077C9114|nr:hypothetical protein [Paenibacillus polymyxa]KYG95703.1 hypothetical protein AZE31_18155 [Paenibacillus polymyxa]